MEPADAVDHAEQDQDLQPVHDEPDDAGNARLG